MMYSKQDRELFLAEFHASGFTIRRFTSIPGNPSRQSITEWLKLEREGLLDVPVKEVRGRTDRFKHERYTAQTKQEAVNLYKKGMRYCDIARRLNISNRSIISKWVRDAGCSSDRGKVAPKEVVAMDTTDNPEVERLKAELEASIMHERVLLELMRDPKAGNPENLSNKQKIALGEKLRRDFGYSQKQVVTFFGMPRSTYAYGLKARLKAIARAELIAEKVRKAFEESKRTYGYRRVRAAMAAWSEPFYATEREVRRAMRENCMVPVRTRKRERYSSYAGEPDTRPQNLPLRTDGTHDFSTSVPNKMVVTDVTEFTVGSGKVYLSPIVDCFDGLPVTWSISTHPDSKLCNSSLERYLARHKTYDEVVCHTDGGCCYRTESWKEICARNGVVRSMSRKGRSPDNARAEGFFGTLKEEFYNGRDWKRCDINEFIEQLNVYIEWYCTGRLKAFREDGRTVYDTILGRRKRLGYVD